MATITKDATKVVISITAHSSVFKFVWWGGEYIDVFFIGSDSCHDLINVWDYEAGETRVPFTPDGFAEAISAWLLEVN